MIMVILREFFFSRENTLEGCTGIHKLKFIFDINKYLGEMVIMNDLEWLILSYDVTYYEKFRKVMQQTGKES